MLALELERRWFLVLALERRWLLAPVLVQQWVLVSIVVPRSALELELAAQRIASQHLSQHSTTLLFGLAEALGLQRLMEALHLCWLRNRLQFR